MPIYTVQSDRVANAIYAAMRRRLISSFALLVICVLVFSAGFFVITYLEGVEMPIVQRCMYGIWSTLNLVSTVGALPTMTVYEQAWSIITIVVGLGAVLHGFASLQALFQRDMAQLLERRRMERILGEYRDHVIVCGFGRVGMAVTTHLREHDVSVIVVDQDPKSIAQADELEVMTIEGDATDEDTLMAASIRQARGLIAALDNDASNVYLTLIARELEPRLRIISRADRPESRMTLRRAGVDRAIVPSDLAALQLSHLMLKPKVSEFIAAATGEGEYDFAEVDLREFPRLVGKTLRELELPRRAEAIIISIVSESGNHQFNPSGDRKLKETDTLILVCRQGGIQRIASLAS